MSLCRPWQKVWLLSQSKEKSLDDLHFLKSCLGPCAGGDWIVVGTVEGGERWYMKSGRKLSLLKCSSVRKWGHRIIDS